MGNNKEVTGEIDIPVTWKNYQIGDAIVLDDRGNAGYWGTKNKKKETDLNKGGTPSP